MDRVPSNGQMWVVLLMVLLIVILDTADQREPVNAKSGKSDGADSAATGIIYIQPLTQCSSVCSSVCDLIAPSV